MYNSPMKSRPFYLAVLALLLLLCAGLSGMWLALALDDLEPRDMIAAYARLAAGLVVLTVFLAFLPAYAEWSLRRRHREILEGLRDERELLESRWDDLAAPVNALMRRHRALSGELDSLRLAVERNEHLASMGRIVSGIVHEIRTPLTNIIGYSQLALEDADDRKVGKDIVKIIEAAKRCERITDSLLAFSRTRTPAFEQVKFRDLIALSTAKVDDVEIEMSFPDGAAGMMGDPTLLGTVVRNLVSNSIDAGARSIRFASERDGGSIRLFCRDNGRGIPSAVSGSVFEPFKSSKKGGLGLGMALVRSAVEAHGGTIQARNRPEGGAEIELVLPVMQTGSRLAGASSLKN